MPANNTLLSEPAKFYITNQASEGASFVTKNFHFFQKLRRLRVEFFCFSNTMKFRILENFALIITKVQSVFVFKFNH